MTRLIASSFGILLLSLSFVKATRFCQCENPGFGRIFPGINNVCDSMGEDWCSTNCNSVGYNCDYCQFKPAGYGSDDDYHKLVSWCGNQQGYDSNKQVSYKGTDVFCYSYKNCRPKGFWDGGCSHQNNGDWPLPPDQVRDATVLFRYPFRNEYVKRTCVKLLRKDGRLLVEGYLKDHADIGCKWLKNETTSHVLECPYSESGRNRYNLREWFKEGCNYYGGEWHALQNGPALAVPASGAFSGQRVLSRPQGIHSNIIDDDEDSPDDPGDDNPGDDNPGDDIPPPDNPGEPNNPGEPDNPGDDIPPHGPGDVDEPDDPNKHEGDEATDRRGRVDDVQEERVIYEHSGIKIIFVA